MPKVDQSTSLKGRKAGRFSGIQVVWRFTVLFVAVSLIIFFPFITKWRTFIWSPDGYERELKALIFYSEWLKAGCPADYSLSLGYGADIISTLQSYCLGEPLAALSFFVPRDYMVHFYCALSVFRHYLAGLSFAAAYAYARKGRATMSGTTAGALIYAYCGFAVHLGTQQPMLMTSMIYLPLLILGTEKYLRERKPAVLMISVLLSAVTGFRPFIVLTLTMAVYYIIFGVIRIGKTGFGGFIGNGFALLGLYAVGTAMAGVVLAPVMHDFVRELSFKLPENTGYLYEYAELLRVPEAVLTGEPVSGGMILGFGALTVPALFMIITGIRKHPGVFISFIFLIAALAVPVFSYDFGIFGGDGRVMGAAMLLAVMGAVSIDELKQSGKLRGTAVFLGSLLYIGGIAYLYYREGRLDPGVMDIMTVAQAALVLITALVMLAVSFSSSAGRRAGIELAAFLGIVSVAASGCWHFAEPGDNSVSAFLAPEEIVLDSSAAAIVSDLGDEEFFRFDYSGDLADDENSALIYGLSSVRGSIGQYETIAPADQLAAVKYFVTESGNAPYGFEVFRKNMTGRSVYRNTYPVSMVHSYTRLLDEEVYEQLPCADRSYALLMGAMAGDVRGKLSVVLGRVEPDPVSDEIKYSVSSETKDAVLRIGGIKVSSEGGRLVLKPGRIREGEYFLTITDLSLKKAGANAGSPEDTAVRVSFIRLGEVLSEVELMAGAGDQTLESGWSPKGIDKIVLEFSSPGEYRFGSLELRHADEESIKAIFDEYASADQADVDLHDEAMRNVTGSITASGRWMRDSLVMFSVPSDDGWSAEVDGQPSEIIAVNGGFIGIQVDSGRHDIELSYQSPWKLWGLIATVSGAVIFAMVSTMAAYGRKKRKNVLTGEDPGENNDRKEI